MEADGTRHPPLPTPMCVKWRLLEYKNINVQRPSGPPFAQYGIDAAAGTLFQHMDTVPLHPVQEEFWPVNPTSCSLALPGKRLLVTVADGLEKANRRGTVRPRGAAAMARVSWVAEGSPEVGLTVTTATACMPAAADGERVPPVRRLPRWSREDVPKTTLHGGVPEDDCAHG
ncbi:hypothetical protein NDU88_002379 [Pleurodeles waltl]|uniref:Uncharacterized protein n=1 Tax=Pleurodeles waltl TaxID=8319 RepID=A0AAV7U934_PLEWA|nr:hypothetical protein NDU88_002379 [Pleurodeles waltl]